jgi:peptidoglycan hydrolase-like protein with peptidoglycan-binding domain
VTSPAALATLAMAPGLTARQNLLDQGRFVQKPQSGSRSNFQFGDDEIRAVQAALRRLGIYSGQVDGILGADTQRAVEDYQVENKLPVTGQADQRLKFLAGHLLKNLSL